MDAYLVRTKATTSSYIKPSSLNAKVHAQPTIIPLRSVETKTRTLRAIEGGTRAANQSILKTLKDPDNPITNSTSYERTLHLQGCGKGHEGGGGGGGGGGEKWAKLRARKLKEQAPKGANEPLRGVVIYINGLTDASNLALMKLVQSAGARTQIQPSSHCTHILAHGGLSASKTESLLKRRRAGIKVVTPAWATDSIALGVRQPEFKYAVVFQEGQPSISSLHTSPSKRHVSTYECPADIPLYVQSSPPIPHISTSRHKRSRSEENVEIKKREKIVKVVVNRDEEDEDEEEEFAAPSCGQRQ